MITWAARRPAVIWSIGLAIMLAGGVAFTKLPLATKTRVELPKLNVSTSWPGASSELIETYITSPIEDAIQSVRGVKKISSTSGEQGSNITVELELKADVTQVRLAIHERLELLRDTWPAGAAAPSVSNYVPDDLDERPLMIYTVSGPYTPGTLTRLAREQITPRLSAVSGVSSVSTFGLSESGVAVTYDPVRLRQLDLSPELIGEAITGSRLVQSLGENRRGASVITVALRDQPNVLADLEALPIRAPSGRIFRLGDLASVRPDEDNRGAFFRLDGRPAVALQVARLPGADAIQTAERIRAAMDEIRVLLPRGITFNLAQDDSVDLQKQLRDLVLRGGVAFLAVLLVLAFSLRNIKSVWLVMGSAAVAIAGTALGLFLLNIPANLLTLAGLGMGIGILVQDGLVVVMRLRRAPDTIAGRVEAGKKITPAVIGSTLTTAVVLLPFVYLQGNARAAFVPFAAAFTLALFWSVISSLVMIPAVGAGHGMQKHGWGRLQRAYLKSLIGLMRWRWVTVSLVLISLGILTWGFIKKVPRSAFGNWYGERTQLFVSLSFPRGSDPESLDRGITEFERLAVGREGVAKVQAQSFGGGSANMVVEFTKEAGFTTLPSMMQEEMTQRAVLIGGASVGVTGRGPGFFSGGSGASVSFRVKLLGYSFAGVEALAKDLKARLERIPRVREVNINAGSFFRSERAVSVTLAPDRPALARAGITSRTFSAAVAREVRGPGGGQKLPLEGEEVIVTVKAKGARERSLDELRGALVPNPTQSPVRVGDLARVDEREGLSQIEREDQQYVRILSYDFRGPQKLANRTHKSFMASISAPPGYSVGDDQFQWINDDSEHGLWLVFAAGIVLVILAVAFVFDSVWAPVMVFVSLPTALAGVVAIFWATGTAFSREAAVGVILVVGLAVHQAILLIDAALQKRRHGAGPGEGRTFRRLTATDIVFAARDRAGIITLVTLTTLASLVPLAVQTDVDSLFGAIALATAGGTIAGTIGALWIVPVLLMGRRISRKRSTARVVAPAPAQA
ncbi:MAG: efflux RND transporter permease subunit [Gemmatimonadota bacterium]